MRKQVALLAWVAIFTLLGLSAAAQRTLIYAGKVFTGQSDELINQATVVIEGGQIVAVMSSFRPPVPGDTVVHLEDYTVLPGLIDLHVHLEHENTPSGYSDAFIKSDADVALEAARFARITLMSGFTTVRDLGGRGVMMSVRNAINSGKIVGPRIYTSGKQLATTGGHGDKTNGARPDLWPSPGAEEGILNGPFEARKAVRQRYKEGADLIKITATGGVLSVAKDGSGPQFRADELEEVVRTAREYNMKVAAHAHGAEGLQRAIDAGVNTIEHGTFLSKEQMAQMKAKEIWLIPTLSAGAWVAQKGAEPDYYPPLVRPKAVSIGPQIAKTFAEAVKQGVPVAFGTDAGVFPHGDNAWEFELMCENGLTPAQALHSATTKAAQVLGLEEELGQLALGFKCDIIAVAGDPLENISAMRDVVFVMKEGKIYKSPKP